MLLRQNRPIERTAFTLMEIIVVVAIILILAGAGVVVYTSVLAGTREDRAKLDVQSLETAVTTYYTRKGYYPQSLQELTQRDPTDNSPALLKDQKVLMDPWNQPYVYDPNTRHQNTDRPLIYSNGPPNSGKRISNWD
jgi:general secretion pathway protein G